MSREVYRTGQMTLTNGLATAVGIGTSWALAAVAGSICMPQVVGANSSMVMTVEDNTHLTLYDVWLGATGTYNYTLSRETSAAKENVWSYDTFAELLATGHVFSIHSDLAGYIAARNALTLSGADEGFLFLRVEPGIDMGLYRWTGSVWDGPFAVRGEGTPSLATPITAAALAALSAASGLTQGKWYSVTDQGRAAFAIAVNNYYIMPRVTVGTATPTSPQVNDLWVDTN